MVLVVHATLIQLCLVDRLTLLCVNLLTYKDNIYRYKYELECNKYFLFSAAIFLGLWAILSGVLTVSPMCIVAGIWQVKEF